MPHPNLNKKSLHYFLMDPQYIKYIVRRLTDYENLSETSLLLIYELVKETKNIQELLHLKVYSRLRNCYQIHKYNEKIVEKIIDVFFFLVSHNENIKDMLKLNYLMIMVESINSENKTICIKGCKVLNEISKFVQSHDKLFKIDIVKIMLIIISTSKEFKLLETACQLITNLSCNSKYLHKLVQSGVVDVLLKAIAKSDKSIKTYVIIALANMSVTYQF